MTKIYSSLFSFLLGAILVSGCGTLGGFEIITFPISKKKLEVAIDSLYSQYPLYRIPNDTAWKAWDDWSARGYDFLESRLFYFNDTPQELYYVSFVGDSTDLADTSKVSISIRAITSKTSGWKLEKDVSSKESNRIETRFRNEIVEKLELITRSRSKVDRD